MGAKCKASMENKWKTSQKKEGPCLGKVTIVDDVLLRHAVLQAPSVED